MQLPIRITGEARASSLKASAWTIKPALTFSARGSLQLTSVSQCQSYLQDLYFVEKEALFPLRQLYAEDTPLCQNLVVLLLRQSTSCQKTLALQNPIIAVRPFLLPTRPTSSRFKIEKCLLVAGSCEKVLQVSINFITVGFMPGRDCFTDTFEGFKMSLGVPITEFMISNHRNPRFKKVS